MVLNLCEKTLLIVGIVVTCLVSIYVVSSSFKIKENIESYRKNSNDPMLSELKMKVGKIFDGQPLPEILKDLTKEKLNKINIKEDNEEAYTINKKDVYMCLYDKNGDYFHTNNLIYVFAHELAHVICPEKGHTPLWQNMFNAILDELVKRGIYDVNIPMTDNYCSIDNI